MAGGVSSCSFFRFPNTVRLKLRLRGWGTPSGRPAAAMPEPGAGGGEQSIVG